MEIQWAEVLSPLSVIVPLLLMWWRLDNKIESTGQKLDGKIEDVRMASETAHQSIRDDLCDLKVTTATIRTDVEWLKNDRQQ